MAALGFVDAANSLEEAKQYDIEISRNPKARQNQYNVKVGGLYAANALSRTQTPDGLVNALFNVIYEADTAFNEQQQQRTAVRQGKKPETLLFRIATYQINSTHYVTRGVALDTLRDLAVQREDDLLALRNERDADRTEIRDATGRIDQRVTGIAGDTGRIAAGVDRVGDSVDRLANKRFDLSQLVTTEDLDGTPLGNLRDVKLTDLTVGQLARLRETQNGQSREFQLLYLDLPRSTREAVARQQRPRYHAPRSQVQADIDREVLSRQYTDRRTTQRPVRHREADDIVTELPRRAGLGGEIARAGDWSIASSRYDLRSNDRLDYVD